VANQHPSGRPRHHRKVGTSSIVRWPREGFLNPRLEGRRELTGGFGFRAPRSELDDDFHGMAIARKVGKTDQNR
jgi:hypothetical protein